MKTWLITIKGNDTFVYDATITGYNDLEMWDKVKLLLTNVAKTTIEQFVSITIDLL